MRSVGSLTYQPFAEARAARPAGAFAPVGQSCEAIDATVVLPRPQPTRSLPFLAQYLAQEIMDAPDMPSRWGERESAYRAAAAPALASSQQRISLSV